MKTIARKKDQSLYMKIFESKEFDCIIIVYLDEEDNVISMNYHWGKAEINTKYLEFNGKGETTQLYKIFHQINGGHSTKLYNLVIGAHSINSRKDLKIAQLETDLAEEQFNYKKLKGKLTSIKKIAKISTHKTGN
jgi:hypothetical protein